MKQKGVRVTALLICFIGAVFLVLGGIMLYEIKDKATNEELKTEIFSLKQHIKTLSDTTLGNSNSVANCNLRLNAMDEALKSLKSELDVFRDQVGETREKQIKLQDAISKKRPIVKMPEGPIVFEVMTSDKAELFKRAKKQLKDLSK